MFKRQAKGQGLVEYALILVLVAVVVIAILMILGPQISSVFSTINRAMSLGGGGGGSAVTSVNASRDLGGNLTVVVGVSKSTSLTFSGTVTGSGSCSSSCTFSFSGVPLHGNVTVTGSDGSSASDSW